MHTHQELLARQSTQIIEALIILHGLVWSVDQLNLNH